MCGINGFSWKNASVLREMNKQLSHRGPDGTGTFANSKVSLGHVRLSIIDLSKKARQPMVYSHGKKEVIIVFNGEIYNYQELKEQLIEKGYSFKSTSDTEVILASYLEWGVDCTKHFNGMWAFALYDRSKERLFCSRDRLGQKPFYYYWDCKRFIFSSEIKGILAHRIRKEIDQDSVDIYLTAGFIPSPMTIYKNVFKLEPRQSLIFDLNKKRIARKWFYYDFPRYNPIYSKKRLIKEGRELLRDATRLRLIADVPIGAFLSGGLDSSVVVSEMSHFVNLKRLHTFSLGFEGKYDESKYIEIVKDKFKTIHHHSYFTEKDFDKLKDKISFYYDEPFGNYSSFPTVALSKIARKQVKVVLTGDGGDEIFGGYGRHQIAAQMALMYKIPSAARQMLQRIIPLTADNNSLPSKVHEALRVSRQPKEKFFAELGSSTLYKPPAYQRWAEERFRTALQTCGYNFVEGVIRFDQFYNTMGDHFLVKTDRATMAHGLEARSPFLDHRFIEYAARIPAEWKADTRHTKKLMKEMVKDILPEEIVYRKKQGFVPPLERWIVQDQYLSEIAEGIGSLSKAGIISKQWSAFYKRKALKTDNDTFNAYKIRMFLLLKWAEQWVL